VPQTVPQTELVLAAQEQNQQFFAAAAALVEFGNARR
jgi:hypothetical protein